MFNIGQVTAVKGAFLLAGYDGDLRTMPVDSEDERLFVLPQAELLALSDVRTLEQVVGQILGVKVAILDDLETPTVRFE